MLTEDEGASESRKKRFADCLAKWHNLPPKVRSIMHALQHTHDCTAESASKLLDKSPFREFFTAWSCPDVSVSIIHPKLQHQHPSTTSPSSFLDMSLSSCNLTRARLHVLHFIRRYTAEYLKYNVGYPLWSISKSPTESHTGML